MKRTLEVLASSLKRGDVVRDLDQTHVHVHRAKNVAPWFNGGPEKLTLLELGRDPIEKYAKFDPERGLMLTIVVDAKRTVKLEIEER